MSNGSRGLISLAGLPGLLTHPACKKQLFFYTDKNQASVICDCKNEKCCVIVKIDVIETISLVSHSETELVVKIKSEPVR